MTGAGSVIIVGAGPVGLALACELGLRGADCTLIEKRDGPITVNDAGTRARARAGGSLPARHGGPLRLPSRSRRKARNNAPADPPPAVPARAPERRARTGNAWSR